MSVWALNSAHSLLYRVISALNNCYGKDYENVFSFRVLEGITLYLIEKNCITDRCNICVQVPKHRVRSDYFGRERNHRNARHYAAAAQFNLHIPGVRRRPQPTASEFFQQSDGTSHHAPQSGGECRRVLFG